MKRQHQNQTSGFTLVELIIVLAVISIIMMVAVPSLLGILANNRVSTSANEMVAALNLAKTEAIRSGQPTVLCKSSVGTECTADSQWHEGWLLFKNTVNQDDPMAVDKGDLIVRVRGPLDERLGFNFRSVSDSYLSFKANGFASFSGRFCFKNDYDKANSRAVVIYRGRIRTEKRHADDDCAA